MNEQPQPLPQRDVPENEQPLYRAADAPAAGYTGYDLTAGAQPAITPAAPTASSGPLLVWEASEYVHHSKSFLWYVAYAVMMLALLALAYFLTHAWTFIILVVVMAAAIGVYASRPPRTLHYLLTEAGVQIENSQYSYADFRAFGVVDDGALYSIMLIPTKRFSPAVTMYFAEADGEKIVDILGTRLPMEQMELDSIDRLMRKLRF